MSDTSQPARPGITRREAIKGMAAGAAVAAATGPTILIADQAEKGPDSLILGSGDHKYELVRGWGSLPEGKAFGYTHGVAEDSQGRIYIHHTGPGDTMFVFDPDGKFIKSWGPEYEGGAHGLQWNKEADGEFFYLAPTGQHRVIKTTLDGEVVFELGPPMDSSAYSKPEEYVPTNIAILPNGEFYVADGYGKSYIHHYNAKGEYLKSWGGGGSEPGKMKCPHGLWVDTRGAEPVLVVADRSNVRLQYFTLAGEHIKFVTEELRHPCHFDQHGTDLLIPDLHGRVTIFDKDDKLIVHLGDNPDVQKTKGYPNLPHDQRVPGKFISPHGAIYDHKGNIYVAEWINDGRVTKLRHVG